MKLSFWVLSVFLLSGMLYSAEGGGEKDKTTKQASKNNIDKRVVKKKVYSERELMERKSFEIIEKAFKKSKEDGVKVALEEFKLYACENFKSDSSKRFRYSWTLNSIINNVMGADAEKEFLSSLEKGAQEASIDNKLFYAFALELSYKNRLYDVLRNKPKGTRVEESVKAEKLYRDVLSLDENNPYANIKLALCLVNENPKHSVYYLRKALAKNSEVVFSQIQTALSENGILSEKLQYGYLIASIFREIDENDQNLKSKAFSLLIAFEKPISGNEQDGTLNLASVFCMYPSIEKKYSGLLNKRLDKYLNICEAAYQLKSLKVFAFYRMLAVEIAAGRDISKYIPMAKDIIKGRPENFNLTYATSVYWTETNPAPFVHPECLLVNYYNKNGKRQELLDFISGLDREKYAGSISAMKEIDNLYTCKAEEFLEKSIFFMREGRDIQIVSSRFISAFRVFKNRKLDCDYTEELLAELKSRRGLAALNDPTPFMLWTFELVEKDDAEVISKWFDSYISMISGVDLDKVNSEEALKASSGINYLSNGVMQILKVLMKRRQGIAHVINLAISKKYLNLGNNNAAEQMSWQLSEAIENFDVLMSLAPMQDWDKFSPLVFSSRSDTNSSVLNTIFNKLWNHSEGNIEKLKAVQKKTFGSELLLSMLENYHNTEKVFEYLAQYSDKINALDQKRRYALFVALRKYIERTSPPNEEKLSGKAKEMFLTYKSSTVEKAMSEVEKFLALDPIEKLDYPSTVYVNGKKKTITARARMGSYQYREKAAGIIVPVVAKDIQLAEKLSLHALKQLARLQELEKERWGEGHFSHGVSEFINRIASGANNANSLIFVNRLAMNKNINSGDVYSRVKRKFESEFSKIYKPKLNKYKREERSYSSSMRKKAKVKLKGLTKAERKIFDDFIKKWGNPRRTETKDIHVKKEDGTGEYVFTVKRRRKRQWMIKVDYGGKKMKNPLPAKVRAFTETADIMAEKFKDNPVPLLCSHSFWIGDKKYSKMIEQYIRKQEYADYPVAKSLLLHAVSTSKGYDDLSHSIFEYPLMLAADESISPAWRFAMESGVFYVDKYIVMEKLKAFWKCSKEFRDNFPSSHGSRVFLLTLMQAENFDNNKDGIKKFLELVTPLYIKEKQNSKYLSDYDQEKYLALARCYFQLGDAGKAFDILENKNFDLYSYPPIYAVLAKYCDPKSVAEIIKKNWKNIKERGNCRCCSGITNDDKKKFIPIIDLMETEDMRFFAKALFANIPFYREHGNPKWSARKQSTKALLNEFVVRDIDDGYLNRKILRMLLHGREMKKYPEAVLRAFTEEDLDRIMQTKLDNIYGLFMYYIQVVADSGDLKLLKACFDKAKKNDRNITSMLWYFAMYLDGSRRDFHPERLLKPMDDYLECLEFGADGVRQMSHGFQEVCNCIITFNYALGRYDSVDRWLREWSDSSGSKILKGITGRDSNKMKWKNSQYLFNLALKSAKDDKARTAIIAGYEKMLNDMPKLTKYFRDSPEGNIDRLVEKFRLSAKAFKATAREEVDVF